MFGLRDSQRIDLPTRSHPLTRNSSPLVVWGHPAGGLRRKGQDVILQCSGCGFSADSDDPEIRVPADDGAFGPGDGDPDGQSYNQVCPECGAENSFEEA